MTNAKIEKVFVHYDVDDNNSDTVDKSAIIQGDKLFNENQEVTGIKLPSGCYFKVDNSALCRMAAVVLNVHDGIYANSGYIVIGQDGVAQHIDSLSKLKEVETSKRIDIKDVVYSALIAN